ncbi:cytochrome p450 oxidoreductase [Fusarium phyllophilum]|uniref:Cytochrome p450 oxidoreductase n=1 Tax=Fusarium phyllophilum TaxID=47803 RepID=A0A8H5ISY4_9HYPO|nr:cytochrome p450 oxidoreductase [Fusarium phyllophilum]
MLQIQSIAALGAVAGTALTLWLIFSLYRVFTSPLRAVPGPLLARYTNLWYLWRLSKSQFAYENIALHEKYGNIVRYGPNRFSFCDPRASKVIYGHGSHFVKSSWYTTFGNPEPHHWGLFPDQNSQRIAQNRRQYQSMYSMSSLVTYEPYVDECADLLGVRLEEMAHANLPVDMGHWFQCYAFDVIGMITYSKRLGFLDRGEDIGGLIKTLEGFLSYASMTGLFPFLHTPLSRINNWLAGSKGSGRSFIGTFTEETVREHESAPKASRLSEEGQPGIAVDFLTKFMSKHRENPGSFTRYHILEGCVGNMIAGSDTTAISLSALLYYILRNRRVFYKLREEVDVRCREGNMSKSVTYKETLEMPYFQAVMKETLRLHPATGLPLERVVPKGGTTICDQFFPEGDVFGDDADEFRPERWLEGDLNKLSMMNHHWMPFGLGSRTCIGRHISWLEISKLVPRLVRDYDFELAGHLEDPRRRWETSHFFFIKPQEFIVRVKPRCAVSQ